MESWAWYIQVASASNQTFQPFWWHATMSQPNQPHWTNSKVLTLITSAPKYASVAPVAPTFGLISCDEPRFQPWGLDFSWAGHAYDIYYWSITCISRWTWNITSIISTTARWLARPFGKWNRIADSKTCTGHMVLWPNPCFWCNCTWEHEEKTNDMTWTNYINPVPVQPPATKPGPTCKLGWLESHMASGPTCHSESYVDILFTFGLYYLPILFPPSASLIQ